MLSFWCPDIEPHKMYTPGTRCKLWNSAVGLQADPLRGSRKVMEMLVVSYLVSTKSFQVTREAAKLSFDLF